MQSTNQASCLAERQKHIFTVASIFPRNLIYQTFDIKLKDHDDYSSSITREQLQKGYTEDQLKGSYSNYSGPMQF